MAIPLLDPLDIDGTVITADALLTQVKFARYLVEDKKAHYHFTVKANQATLLEDLQCFFEVRKAADASTVNQGHGRIETRKIWITSKLNDYLSHVRCLQSHAAATFRQQVNFLYPRKTAWLSSWR